MQETTTNNTLNKVLTVDEICQDIKSLIERRAYPAQIEIKGEIFQISTSQNKHKYITLKGKEATLQAVVWGSNNLGGYVPTAGTMVICKGKIKVYSPQSRYQLVIDSMVPEGDGALFIEFEKRKKELLKKGYFDPAYKKPIPFLPSKIAIVTSKEGAVLHDILHRLRDRFPVPVLLCPVAVQGEKAPQEISQALQKVNSLKGKSRPDLIIVARGGGSLQDLWAFNEELVVEAIFQSQIPVISAVGHETDNTLADLVADFRCPTPTASAEKAVPVKRDLEKTLISLYKGISEAASFKIHNGKSLFKAYYKQFCLFPSHLMRQKKSQLSESKVHLFRFAPVLLQQKKSKIPHLLENLPKVMENFTKQKKSQLSEKIKLLGALSYKSVVKRGFACVLDQENKPITKVQQALDCSTIKLEFSDGTIKAKPIK